MTEPCKDHIDNNFKPLNDAQKDEFGKMADEVITFISRCMLEIKRNDYTAFDQLVEKLYPFQMHLLSLKRMS